MNALPSLPVFAKAEDLFCLFLFTRESVAQMSGHHAFCTYSIYILWTRVISQSVVSTVTGQVLVPYSLDITTPFLLIKFSCKYGGGL